MYVKSESFFLPTECLKQLKLCLDSIDKRGRNPMLTIDGNTAGIIWDDLNCTTSVTSNFNFPDLDPDCAPYSIDLKPLMGMSQFLKDGYVHFIINENNVTLQFGDSTLDYGRIQPPVDNSFGYSKEYYSYTLSQERLNEVVGMSLLLEGKKGRNMIAWVHDGVFHMGCKLGYESMITKFPTPKLGTSIKDSILMNFNIYTLLKFIAPIPSHVPITLRFMSGRTYGSYLDLEASFSKFKLHMHIGERGNPHETDWLKKLYPDITAFNKPLFYR